MSWKYLKQSSDVATLLQALRFFCLSRIVQQEEGHRAMLTDRATPMAKVVCGVVQGPMRA